MVPKHILDSAVRDDADGTFWLITTPERYHRDIEPGSNQVFAFKNGTLVGGDSEVAVVLAPDGTFLRWVEPAEYYNNFGEEQ